MRRSELLVAWFLLTSIAAACGGRTSTNSSSSDAAGGVLGGTDRVGGGTAVGSGGTVASGGVVNTGGTVAGSGGATPNTGGTATTGGTTSTGGTVSAGGTIATGGVTNDLCDSVVPCGGDLIGTWRVSDSCLRLEGDLDVIGLGVGCRTMSIRGTLDVDGSITFGADGSYTDELRWTGSGTLLMAEECLVIESTVTRCYRFNTFMAMWVGREIGLSSVDCVEDAMTDGCTCEVRFDHVPSDISGMYTVADNVISTDTGAEYAYCVDGTTMKVTPKRFTEDTTTGQTGSVTLGNQAHD